jgi:hypothetical protein
MIQPQELRIGNYVNSHKGYTKVVGVLCDMLETETHSNILDNFDPIPITPDILERFGFKRTNRLFSLIFNENGAAIFINLVNSVYSLTCFPVEFLYVHQLQNLFYSLTGIELTFKTT